MAGEPAEGELGDGGATDEAVLAAGAADDFSNRKIFNPAAQPYRASDDPRPLPRASCPSPPNGGGAAVAGCSDLDATGCPDQPPDLASSLSGNREREDAREGFVGGKAYGVGGSGVDGAEAFRPTAEQRAYSLSNSSAAAPKPRLENRWLSAAPNNGGEHLDFTNAIRPGEAPPAESPTGVANGPNSQGATPRGRDRAEETPVPEYASASSLLVDANQADIDVEEEGIIARRVAMVPSPFAAAAAATTEPDIGRGRTGRAQDTSPAEGGGAGATEWGSLPGIETGQAAMGAGDVAAAEPSSGATLMRSFAVARNDADVTWPDIVLSASSDIGTAFEDDAGSGSTKAGGSKPSGGGRAFGVTSPPSIDTFGTAGSAAQASRPSMSLQSEGSVCSSIAASHRTSSSVTSMERKGQLNIENIRRDWAINAEQARGGLLGFPGAVGVRPPERGDSLETSTVMANATSSSGGVSGPMHADAAQGTVEFAFRGKDATKPWEADEKADLHQGDDGGDVTAGNAEGVTHASAEIQSEDAGDAGTVEASLAAGAGAASTRPAAWNTGEVSVARDEAAHDREMPGVVLVVKHTAGDDDPAAAAEDVNKAAEGIRPGTDADASPASLTLISRPPRPGGAETDTARSERLLLEESIARLPLRSGSGSGSSLVHDRCAKKMDRTLQVLKRSATEPPSVAGGSQVESLRKFAATSVSTRGRRRAGATLEELFPSRGRLGVDEPDSRGISVEEAAAFMGTRPYSRFACRSSWASTGGGAGALVPVTGSPAAALAKTEGLARGGTPFESLVIADPHDFLSPEPDGSSKGIRAPRVSSEFVPAPMLSPGDPLRSNPCGAVLLAGDAFVSSEGGGDGREASEVQQPSMKEPVVVLAEEGRGRAGAVPRLSPPRDDAIDVVPDPSAPRLAPSSETVLRGVEEGSTPKGGPLAAVDRNGKDDEDFAATAAARAALGQSVAAPDKPPIAAAAGATAGDQEAPAQPVCTVWSATADASVNAVGGGGADGVSAVDDNSEKIGGGVFGEGTSLPGHTMTGELSMIEGEAERVHPSRALGRGCCVIS